MLLLHVKLPLTVVCEGKVIDVLHKLLGDVSQTLKPAGQQEEGLNVVLASRGYRPFKRHDFFVNAALLIAEGQKDEEHNLGLLGPWASLLVLLHLGKDLILIDLPIIQAIGVGGLVLPVEDQDGDRRLEYREGFEEAVLEEAQLRHHGSAGPQPVPLACGCEDLRLSRGTTIVEVVGENLV